MTYTYNLVSDRLPPFGRPLRSVKLTDDESIAGRTRLFDLTLVEAGNREMTFQLWFTQEVANGDGSAYSWIFSSLHESIFSMPRL